MQKVFCMGIDTDRLCGIMEDRYQFREQGVMLLLYFHAAVEKRDRRNSTGCLLCHYYLYRCADDKGQEAAAGG